MSEFCENIDYNSHNPFSGDWLDAALRACKHTEETVQQLNEKEFEMKLFIDCEFNGMGGQLLSIALVPLDKQLEPLYREQVVYEPVDNWVTDNVFPKLDHYAFGPKFKIPCSRAQLQADLAMYLNQYDCIHLISD